MHRLHDLRLRLVLTAAALLLTASATAQICTPFYTPSDAYTYRVGSQSMLDDLAQRCTTVNGSVAIDSNYTGPFYFPNVRNITGAFSWHFYEILDHPAPKLTSINLPDLEYLGAESYLHSLPTLRNVSMPKLKTAKSVIDLDYVHEVDFRSLETALSLQFHGNMSSLRLDSLRNVNRTLEICNKDSCNDTITAPNPLNVSLPSLQSLAAADLEGNLASLDVSSLTTVSGNREFHHAFRFSTHGGPTFNLSFPRLSYLRGGIDFGGGIESLSMPKLRNISRSFVYITATRPLDINLPFTDVSGLRIYGDISSVKFPNLKHVSLGFIVNSTLRLDCDSISTTILNATNTTEVGCVSAADSDPETNSGGGLSKGAKIAIGVVVGVVGLAGIFGALLLFRKRERKRQQTQLAATESNLRLQEVTPPTYKEAREDSDRDPVPEYRPRLSK